MNIEELTPEYIFNKLEEGFKSNNLSNIDLSVGNMDIRTIEKTVNRRDSLFIVERVSTKYDWDDCIYGLDYPNLVKCHVHTPDHFYILNFEGGGFKSSAVKKKKDRKGCCERICMEIICRSYGIDYYREYIENNFGITIDELWEELKLKGSK